MGPRIPKIQQHWQSMSSRKIARQWCHTKRRNRDVNSIRSVFRHQPIRFAIEGRAPQFRELVVNHEELPHPLGPPAGRNWLWCRTWNAFDADRGRQLQQERGFQRTPKDRAETRAVWRDDDRINAEFREVFSKLQGALDSNTTEGRKLKSDEQYSHRRISKAFSGASRTTRLAGAGGAK